jgi:hypothetical protein
MRRLAAIVLGLSLLGIATPAGATAAPTAHVGSSNVNIGDRVLVQGEGWPAGTLVLLQLCGNGAIDTSADCDVVGGINAGVGPDGTFSMTLRASRPPAPCPCVVWITDSASAGEARVPINVVGLPTAPVRQRAEVLDLSQSVKVSAKITGGSWTTWFGAGSSRMLELTVKNAATMSIPEPRVNITFGKGQNPTGFVAPPSIGTIGPGETRTYNAPISVDTFSFGKYTLTGELAGFGKPVPFHTSISVYPWGLLLVAIASLQLVLLYVRDRARDRMPEDEQAEELAAAGVASAPPIAAVNGDRRPGLEIPIRWARSKWAAASAPAGAAWRRRPRPTGKPAPGVSAAPPVPARVDGQSAWLTAAAAWGRNVRVHRGEEAPATSTHPLPEKVPTSPAVIDLTDNAQQRTPGGLESLAILPQVDTLSYWVTELYSGALPAKNGAKANGGNGSRKKPGSRAALTRKSASTKARGSSNGTSRKPTNGSARKTTNGVAKKSSNGQRVRSAAKS